MRRFLSAVVSAAVLGAAVTSPLCSAESNSFYDEAHSYDSSHELGTMYFDTTDFYANYSEGSYNYGTFLDENNVQVYMEMMKLINPSTETVTVKLPKSVKFTVSTPDPELMTDDDILAYRNALFANCRPGIDCALFDIPELFWIDLSKMGVNIRNYDISYNYRKGNYTIEMSEISFTPVFFDSYESLDEVMEYKQKLKEAVENFPVNGDTRYEQLKSIHDYICTYTFYDSSSLFTSSAIGALVEPGAVCEAYAEGFKIICDNLKIPCVLVIGNFSDTDDVAHMWNYVMMEDEKWYAVDLTWDDLDGYGGRELKYQYFLKGADTFSIAHTPSAELGITKFTYPELSKADYDPNSSVVTDLTTTTTTSSTTLTTTTTSSVTSTESTTTTSSDREFATGDVNHDGKVNSADLVYCTKTVLAIHKPEYSCDVDNDGVTDAFDLVYLRKILLGLI